MARKIKTVKIKKGKPRNRDDGCGWDTCMYLLGLLAFLVVLLVLNLGQEEFNFQGLEMKPPTTDYYQVLGVPSTSNSRGISKAYRKLAIKWHPDKNKNCGECVEKFQEISEAYKVLGNAEQREIYDTLDTSYQALKSAAIELTVDNFDGLVTSSNTSFTDVWVIQVYSDWHRSCIAFSSMWEDSIAKLGKFVKFGRIHIKRQEALVRQLPVVFGSVPSILIYHQGRFIKTRSFGGVQAPRLSLKKLTNYISASFPNTIKDVSASLASVLQFQSNAQAEGKTGLLYFGNDCSLKNVKKRAQAQTESRETFAPLHLRHLAYNHESSFVVGRVDCTTMSKSYDYRDFLKVLRKSYPLFSSFSSSDLKLPFAVGFPSSTTLSSSSAEAGPFLLKSSKLTSKRLSSFMGEYSQHQIAVWSTGAFKQQCVQPLTDDGGSFAETCVVLLLCDAEDEKISHRPDVVRFRELSSQLLSLSSSAYSSVQFGVAATASNPDLESICNLILPSSSSSSSTSSTGSVFLLETCRDCPYPSAFSVHRHSPLDGPLRSVDALRRCVHQMSHQHRSRAEEEEEEAQEDRERKDNDDDEDEQMHVIYQTPWIPSARSLSWEEYQIVIGETIIRLPFHVDYLWITGASMILFFLFFAKAPAGVIRAEDAELDRLEEQMFNGSSDDEDYSDHKTEDGQEEDGEDDHKEGKLGNRAAGKEKDEKEIKKNSKIENAMDDEQDEDYDGPSGGGSSSLLFRICLAALTGVVLYQKLHIGKIIQAFSQ